MEFSEFQEKVLDRSNERPVVVDFWAPWCGPCQMLGPVIEELASEANGKWELVKVNTDESQEVAGKYGIRGIPAVKMYSKGKIVADFTGALPKYQIQKWLDENIPDERLNELDKILQDNKIDRLREFAEANPDLDQARLKLAGMLLKQNPDEAELLIRDIKPDPGNLEQLETLSQIILFLKCDKQDGTVAEHLAKSKEYFLKDNLDGTVDELVRAVMIDKMYCDELPRKTAIAFFKWLGPEHEITKKYRRRFDMALY